MSGIKNKIMDRLVQPSSREVTTVTTVAKVIASDEINNKCSITYIDKNGIKRNRDNVVVRLYDNGSGYFPDIGDFVEVQLEREICVIIARHIANYNMDVRSKMQLKQDIFTDSPGANPGASVF